ncbi:hypothetical protein [Paractinoplanes lichenicola]|uniref:hypothetical protein n=1 Tax=Paractinoplanes lichenicola TaxID=2802976 RepID=UPI001F308D47|nr:hypothetical protein [Actinoplanes lichenicola]
MLALIEQKRTAERGSFPAELKTQLRFDAADLRAELESARDAFALPALVPPAAVDAPHGLVVEAGLATV